ncbi:MAG: uncharacterized membrane protein (DUF441 family) [Flavobacterium sp.]|jgi:uncharacterized membrane protein (DUF441 family)
MRMTDIRICAALVIMILLLGLSFISKNTVNSTLCVAISIIIGAIIFRQLSNQKN